jgi:hypothetical protein
VEVNGSVGAARSRGGDEVAPIGEELSVAGKEREPDSAIAHPASGDAARRAQIPPIALIGRLLNQARTIERLHRSVAKDA